ncbi:MAG: GNAT family N-acetyltransferase [Flavobacteriales bacterium]|nr:GNAT family N-acetyltransferase [Flavobacteriales bacterium]
MEKINWNTKAFNDLTVNEYWEILHLRTAIFVVEQDCPYQEVDEKDRKSYHLFGRNEQDEVIATSRIVLPGISYPEVSIGRVALKKEERGKGIADRMMLETFAFIGKTFGDVPVRISAQEYLKNFYSKHGFKQVSESYLEDDIPHIEMLWGKVE